MKDKGFNTQQIFDVFAERATELAATDTPMRDLDTMVAESQFKSLAKQYLIN